MDGERWTLGRYVTPLHLRSKGLMLLGVTPLPIVFRPSCARAVLGGVMDSSTVQSTAHRGPVARSQRTARRTLDPCFSGHGAACVGRRPGCQRAALGDLRAAGFGPDPPAPVAPGRCGSVLRHAVIFASVLR